MSRSASRNRSAGPQKTPRVSLGKNVASADAIPTTKAVDWLILLIASGLWSLSAAAIATRYHLVLLYQTVPTLTPSLEFVGAPIESLLFIGCVSIIWLFFSVDEVKNSRGAVRASAVLVMLAALPVLLVVMRMLGAPSIDPTFFEPLWMSFFTGLAVGKLAENTTTREPSKFRDYLGHWSVVAIATTLAAIWWYAQSRSYYNNFLLGFNDFGHFTQRVASTSSGSGWLRESPVLPPFWDHFNPGLLLLVPLWKLFPTVDLIFAVQSLCLAGGGYLTRRLAIAIGASPIAATLWGLAWLAHPSLGQMNLAYTYGWHPVSLSMPTLLASLLFLYQKRLVIAALLAVIACSMEENVIVITGFFAAVQSVRCMFNAWRKEHSSSNCKGELTGGTWLMVALACAISFLLAYRFSGFAEFQSGRFIALGGTPVQILLSPVLRPEEFWGQIFRFRTFVFLACLLTPFCFSSLLRGKWLVLPVVLPVLVLVVWDHLPAQSIAFQYAANLLPLLWFASIAGSTSEHNMQHHNAQDAAILIAPREQLRSLGCAAGAMATGLTLSLFLGQFPWSTPTIKDVIDATYAGADDYRRQADHADGKWLQQITDEVRASREPVLATGRVASHLVGCAEVETVGQYLQWKSKLELITRPGQPVIRRYAAIILDLRESFQQQPEETQLVLKEATDNGFRVVKNQFEIILLQADAP